MQNLVDRTKEEKDLAVVGRDVLTEIKKM